MGSSYDGLNFDQFQKLALDNKLSTHQKVGFPDDYRSNKEVDIFNDIMSKLSNLGKPGQKVLEIGPGCSEITNLLIAHLENNNSMITLVDGKNMLDLINDKPFIVKVPGKFPDTYIQLCESNIKYDIILVYSVIQYSFAEGTSDQFVDSCLDLLSSGGQLLIGDIPNNDMRTRFFLSDDGIRHHQLYAGNTSFPLIKQSTAEQKLIDDKFIINLLARLRLKGYDAWVMKQSDLLPMANRREDLLIHKP